MTPYDFSYLRSKREGFPILKVFSFSFQLFYFFGFYETKYTQLFNSQDYPNFQN